MSADKPSRPRGIPDFGAVARRPRLAALIGTHAPGLVLIVAASGYGKSVLAAQYMESRAPRNGFWLDSSRTIREPDSVLRVLLAELDPLRDPEGQTEPCVRSLRNDSEDLVVSIARIVSRLDYPHEAVIVLDDFPDVDSDTVQHLATLGRKLKGLGARLVVTTRALADAGVHSLYDAQVIDGEDLRFTLSEAAQVASAITNCDVAENEVASLHEACAGHPATFTVLLRHADRGPGGWTAKTTPSIDLRSKLIHLAATTLDLGERRTLFLMALLGRGTAADLRFLHSDFTHEGFDRIGVIVPLVSTSVARRSAAPEQFLIHDLAQEVFASDEYCGLLGDFPDDAWPRAVELLVRRGDTLRAALIVEARSDEAGKAAWLLEHGDHVLRRGGSSCLIRMIQQLPVSLFVKSPGLLLVHARLLQERSEFDEAIEKANVARSIAEHDRHELIVAESMLVAAECYSDTGNYEAALELLGRLVARPSTELTRDQKTWALAAMAGCCMYLGRGRESLDYASRAADMARDHASSPGIRSYVLGMAGSIAALVRGDLAGSLSHLIRASESDEVPKALQAKAQGNKAVCLCEMGRLERCIEAVHLSLDTCLEADRGLYRGAFLPVLGAALVGLGSGESGLCHVREGIDLSLDAGDRYGASYNRIYLATALRAAGRSEASLAEAEQALEFFSGIDASSQRELATLELG
ncbi:MAG: AAA family ATPase, partial [Nitrospira sp.]